MLRKEQTAPYDTSNDSTDNMGSEVSPAATVFLSPKRSKDWRNFLNFCFMLTCY